MESNGATRPLKSGLCQHEEDALSILFSQVCFEWDLFFKFGRVCLWIHMWSSIEHLIVCSWWKP